MKAIYPRLAFDGIRKNKRLYLPYILTCIGTVTMFYIIHHLAAMPALKSMPGGDSTVMILGLGVWVVAFFSLIFLVYTNSFLMRRRKKEFGLYNILGMGKWNIGRLLVCETIITAVLSIVCGLIFGIAVSKLAELVLANLLHGEIVYTFSISGIAILKTVEVFSAIFLPFSFGKDGFSLFLKKLLDKSCAVWYPIVSHQ